MALEGKFDIVEFFRNTISANEDISTPVAAIYSLVQFVKYSTATTTFEFSQNIRAASIALQASTKNPIAITAGCDSFTRFVNHTSRETSDVEKLKGIVIVRGGELAADARQCREKCASSGLPFIEDDAVILIHSYSRVITLLLQRAAEANKRFRVYVTESKPSNNGRKAAKILSKMNIPVTVVIDSAVANIMDKVDLVLVGAEGVVENGGIINHVGSYQIGIIAKAANKPLYAIAESYKFVRVFPLHQGDFKHSTDMIQYEMKDGIDKQPLNSDGNESSDPSVDYTPPQYITLLFTDVGALTPSGVGDFLISMYSDE